MLPIIAAVVVVVVVVVVVERFSFKSRNELTQLMTDLSLPEVFIKSNVVSVLVSML